MGLLTPKKARWDEVKFDVPYYIPPHAVERFRERVAPLSTKDIRVEIQSQIQPRERIVRGYAKWDGQVNPVYLGNYHKRNFLITTHIDQSKRPGSWIVVPTVLPMSAEHSGAIHWVRVNGYWKWFETLWESAYTTMQIAKIMEVPQASISRFARRRGLNPRRNIKNDAWSEEERRLIEQRWMCGRDSGEIVREVLKLNPNRAKSSIRVLLHRLKKASSMPLLEGRQYLIVQRGERIKRYCVNGIFEYKGGQGRFLSFRSKHGWELAILNNPATLREYRISPIKDGGENRNSNEVNF
jgi:hypothetical protein